MENKKRLIYLEDAFKVMPALEMCARGLLRLPTVDAVEVVRCKDCIWYEPENDHEWIGCYFDTELQDDRPQAEDFCSRGERRITNAKNWVRPGRKVKVRKKKAMSGTYYGMSIQDGAPTPDNPVPIVNVAVKANGGED